MDDELKNELLGKCVVCFNKNSTKNPCVKKVEAADVLVILNHCDALKKKGVYSTSSLLDRLSAAKEANQLGNVRYHSECRKRIMRIPVPTASSTSASATLKRAGRPKNDDQSTTAPRAKRAVCIPKEVKCVFSACDFCYNASAQLHRVYTDPMGANLLSIQMNTLVDSVRVCLSGLEKPGDAAAQEKYYHLECLQRAQRTCDKKDKVERDKLTRFLCDELLVQSVKFTLFIENTMLKMNDVNEEYYMILQDYGLAGSYLKDQKKYLKELLLRSIPHIQFTPSIRRNESDIVSLSSHVTEAMEFASTHSTSVDTISAFAKELRQEGLMYRDWKFESDLSGFEHPPILRFFIDQVLFGRFSKSVKGKRDFERQKTLDVVCQFLLQNMRSDRQVKHDSVKDEGFRCNIDTPLNIGAPLAVHVKSRDKACVQELNQICLGKDYRQILNIEKRVEQAILERVSDTGFCLPDFTKKGVDTWFALDNIDLLEDTPFGQNTFHGTIIVLNQRVDDSAEPLYSPLKIPQKLPDKPLKIHIAYKDEPVINKKPIRFESFPVGKREHLVEENNKFTHAWWLSSFLANELSTSDDIEECSTTTTPPTPPPTPPPPPTTTTTFTSEGTALVTGQVTSDDVSVELNLDNESCKNPEVEKKIILLTHKSKKKSKTQKLNVMPTWSASQSLLISASKSSDENPKSKMVNTQAVAPLFRTSPTDYATLYTALCLTQDISATVVGPNRRTIITCDLDLYNRALQIQHSVGNKNWILMPGGLHLCFAVEHALGKTLEGSGIDTCAVECGTYSAAAMRGIYSGKAFKRAVEYHLINALAIMMLKFESLPDDALSPELRLQCQRLRDALHGKDPSSTILMSDIQKRYAEVESKFQSISSDGFSQYLDNYLVQLENLLQIIGSCRREAWEAHLAAVEFSVRYICGHDLFNYERLLPIFLAEMNELQIKEPEIWEGLCAGNFAVNKSGIPFTSLFTDQALEQEIKNLKRHGGIVGVSQNEEALDRLVYTTPHLSKIVKNYLASLSDIGDMNPKKEHYQLQGSFSVRCAENAKTIYDKIVLHCDGNPYVNGTPLKNIVSSAIIPDVAKEHILNLASIGQKRYADFVEERLLVSSDKSVWDKITKLKLKTFSNWMEKSKVRVGDKVVKLKEERGLFARFLVIQQSRPGLVPKLVATIGEYEMSVIPRSIFAVDGSLMVCKDKSDLQNAIEDIPADVDAELLENAIATGRVLIIDAMSVVNSMKKTPVMVAIKQLKDAFIRKIMNMSKRYVEVRVIFDHYIEDSLKSKTRGGRATSDVASKATYEIHDEMSIRTISLRELLSSSMTKSGLTKYLSEAILKKTEGSNQVFIVSYQQCTRVNNPHSIDENLEVHGHEEADTLIPLHVIDSVRLNKCRDIQVRCSDTDVFIMLIDLAASNYLGAMTKLTMLTGTGARYREVDIRERVEAIGKRKAKALIGLHNFTGADWGGKFVGLSKKTWVSTFLSLDDDDDIIESFTSLGVNDFSDLDMVDSNFPPHLFPLERFVCMAYSPTGRTILSHLRWDMFSSRNLEGELLPPTKATLFQHIKRANFVAMRDKSYSVSKPHLPSMERNGWQLKAGGGIEPVRCMVPPAPSAVLELIKCGCKKTCSGNCKCAKNNLPCTPLCKCYAWSCNRIIINQKINNDRPQDEEGEDDELMDI